jgi:Na+/proline symporter
MVKIPNIDKSDIKHVKQILWLIIRSIGVICIVAGILVWIFYPAWLGWIFIIFGTIVFFIREIMLSIVGQFIFSVFGRLLDEI